jgi:mRNA-degrading endonuclease RelE of RelBE toxin-antitoxin system
MTRAADRDLSTFAPHDRNTIVDAVKAFAAGNSPNADGKKLAGATPPRWRLRIGRFRVISSIEPERKRGRTFHAGRGFALPRRGALAQS